MTGSGHGALVGLAYGDSVGWPALWQRSRLMPAWTRRRARELMAFADQQQLTDPVVPFGLNVTPTALLPGPGDVTDWVADTWQGAASGLGVDEIWGRRLARADDLSGRISVMVALDAMARDGAANGGHNPHGHDDLAALRSIGYAAALGPDAQAFIEQDAVITNHGDGLAAARLLGSLVLDGPDALTDPTRWGADPNGRLALQWGELRGLADAAPEPWSLTLAIAQRLDAVYSYADLAGDTVPAALAFVRWALTHPEHPGSSLPTLVGAATGLVRQAGSVPALVGGVLGAWRGVEAVPTGWHAALRPSGCSIPWVAGISLSGEDCAHPSQPAKEDDQ
ncbi:hypothetical protein HJ590_12965 [Naumannella sp. ID2617S]|nr:hypothetical protein [Naumannella sp. ID2617S]